MTVRTPGIDQPADDDLELADWAPSWLCLNSGALPGNHRVLTQRAGDRLLVRMPGSGPLLGFAGGASATVLVETADGSIVCAHGLISAPDDAGADAVLDLNLRQVSAPVGRAPKAKSGAGPAPR